LSTIFTDFLEKNIFKFHLFIKKYIYKVCHEIETDLPAPLCKLNFEVAPTLLTDSSELSGWNSVCVVESCTVLRSIALLTQM
jgi:hypothetical protein